jgi:hypothetical protein
MNQLAQKTDVWAPASQEDKIKALVLLGGLPARESANPQVDKASYYLALDGVTRYGLSEAVKSIIRGGLGHTFFPSPVELRLACDRAQQPVRDMQRRITMTEENRRDRDEFDRINAGKTAESRARVAEMTRQMHRAIESDKLEQEEADREAERAAVRARYGMTAETLASIADQPSTFEPLPAPETTRKRTA